MEILKTKSIKNNVMKKLALLLSVLFIGFTTQAQDKKELKKLSKKYSEYDNGAFKKAENVAILGSYVRFKLASHQSESNSWKDQGGSVKFGAYATLKGVEPELLHDIANAYHDMIVAKFKELGMNVVPYANIEAANSYPKLIEKEKREDFQVKKSWGVAAVVNYDNHPFIRWGSAPFTPANKVAKEVDALLFISQVTIDFAAIGIDISKTSSKNSIFSQSTVYTKGTSSVVPMIFIAGYTYPDQGLNMIEDNTFNFTKSSKGKINNLQLDTSPSEIMSETAFATEIKNCSGCKPEFAKGRIALSESNMGTVEITVDPELYKKAVLEVLQQYLDETFALYAAQRN
jgi:hypothetical protein